MARAIDEELKVPELTAVLVTPEKFDTCRPALDHLRKQTVRGQLEVVIVAPHLSDLKADAALLEGFDSYQLVELGHPLESTGRAVAEGFRRAKAALVVYSEEHAYPTRDWAEILIRTHREVPHPAVGFAVGNANPGPVSWAHLFAQFGPVVEPVGTGLATALAGHHVSYKKEYLLGYAQQLGPLMENECALHIDLRERGYQLYVAGEAVSRHVNISEALQFCKLDFLGQWGFGASRARVGGWSRARRLIYVCATPLIPVVRLVRSVRHFYRTGRGSLLPASLPYLLIALVCGAAGEALGYLLGEKAAIGQGRLLPELDRFAFVNQADRSERDTIVKPQDDPDSV